MAPAGPTINAPAGLHLGTVRDGSMSGRPPAAFAEERAKGPERYQNYNGGISGSLIRQKASFSLNFSKISYQYDAFSGDKVTTGTPKKWDLQANAVF